VQSESAIEMRGGLSLPDALHFYYFQTLRRIWWLVALVAILLTIVAPILLAVFVNTYPPVVSWDWVVSHAMLPVFLVLALTFLVLVMPYLAARKLIAAQTSAPKLLKVFFSSEGIRSDGDGFSSMIAWRLLKTVRETECLFLLYLSPGSAMLVPKRFFQNPDELEKWRQLVASSVDPKLIEKPSFFARWC
jgi:hypothetical protein